MIKKIFFPLLLAILFSCTKQSERINVTNTTSLSVVSNALLGTWQSTREPGKRINIITTYPAAVDSNIIGLDAFGTSYFSLNNTIDSAGTTHWSIQIPLKNDAKDIIHITTLTNDTLILYEPLNFLSGIYVKEKP